MGDRHRSAHQHESSQLGGGHSKTWRSLAALRRSYKYVLFGACMAGFTDLFLDGLVVPVLPYSLVARSAIAPRNVQLWTSALLSAYGGAMFLAGPISGYAADHCKTRRIPYFFGLLLLIGSTLILTLGKAVEVLLAGRILQGASAAAVYTAAFALLLDSNPEKIAESMGCFGLSMSLGTATAPILAGIVYDHAGYYAVFAMAYGVIGIDAIFCLTVGEDANKRLADRKATTGMQQGCARPKEMRDLELVDTEETPSTDLKPRLDRSKIAGGSMEQSKWPTVVTLLGSVRLLVALWAAFVNSTLIGAFDSLLPLFAERTFGWHSTFSGLVFLPFAVTSFAQPFVGRAREKWGRKYFVAGGFLFAAAPLVSLRFVRNGSTSNVVLFFALLTLAGVGWAFQIPGIAAEITFLVEERESLNPGIFGTAGAFGQAFGLMNSAMALGILVGPLAFGAVNSSAGWDTAVLVLGVMSASTGVPVLLYLAESSEYQETERGL